MVLDGRSGSAGPDSEEPECVVCFRDDLAGAGGELGDGAAVLSELAFEVEVESPVVGDALGEEVCFGRPWNPRCSQLDLVDAEFGSECDERIIVGVGGRPLDEPVEVRGTPGGFVSEQDHA